MVRDQPTSHRKTFSFIPSFRLFNLPPLPQAAQSSSRPSGLAQGDHAVRLGELSAAPNTTPPLSPTSVYSQQGEHSPLPPSSAQSINSSDLTSLSSPTRSYTSIPRHRMNLARKVKKLRNVVVPDESAPARRLGDMLEDPYSLMTMSPVLLSPSPSPSTKSFTDAQLQPPKLGSIKRSATVRNSIDVPSQDASGIQRSRSLAVLQQKPTLSISPSPSPSPHTRTAPISPIIFAPRKNRSATSLSDTSSALYSESLIPSRTPSFIHSEIKEVEDESPLSEAPTKGAASHGRTPSSIAEIKEEDTGSDNFDAADDDLSVERKSRPDVRLRAASPARRPPSPAASRTPSPSASQTLLLQPHLRLSSPSLLPRPTTSRSPSPSPSLSLAPSPSPSRSPSPIPTHLQVPPQSSRARTHLPLRSTSLRRVIGPRAPVPAAVAAKRRLSLDLRALTPEPMRSAKLRKNRSAFVSRRGGEGEAEVERGREKEKERDEVAGAAVVEDDEAARLGEPMTDKQRVMNVRRARKMMQLFGDKPPKELFQVAEPPGADDTVDTISILTTVSENRRDSRATFTSLASSSISLTVHRRGVRDSVQSISEPPSPLVFTGAELAEARQADVRVHPDALEPESEPSASQSSAQLAGLKAVVIPSQEEAPGAHAHAESHADSHFISDRVLPPLLPASTVPHTIAYHPRPKPSIQSLSLASTTSHTRTLSLHSQAPLNPHGRELEPLFPLPASFTAPLPPHTPPPFSNLFRPPSSESAHDDDEGHRELEMESERTRAQSPPPPPEEFRARRLRAAKLSRFFGVAPNTLADVLASETLPGYAEPRASASGSTNIPGGGHAPRKQRHPAQHPPRPHTSQGHVRGQSTTVEVQAEVPRGFRLGRPEKKAVQEEDMAQVLDKLRRMR